MRFEKPELNRTQTLGLILLAVSVFTYVGGWQWVLAYWDTSLAEEYRGYEIYYFPNINVYGVKIGKETPSNWPHGSSVDALRNLIDTWMDPPELIEQYLGWDIYRQANKGYYYATRGEEETTLWVRVTHLKDYLEKREEASTPEPETPGDTGAPSDAGSQEEEGAETTDAGEDTGEEEHRETIGDLIEARKLVIAAVTGFMGVGLVAFGSVREKRDP